MSDDQYTSSGVEFESERHLLYGRFEPSNKTPALVLWVIKYSGGLVKDEKQAGYVLVGFVVVAIIATIFLFFGGRDNVERPFGGGSNPENFEFR